MLKGKNPNEFISQSNPYTTQYNSYPYYTIQQICLLDIIVTYNISASIKTGVELNNDSICFII